MTYAAPGGEAIDEALAELYPDVKPHSYGSAVRYAEGGTDPLDGVSCYPRQDHWHLVSYGMSELYDKEWDDPLQSGWGLEFTMRVARAAGDGEPPLWAVGFLQDLARSVFARRLPFTTVSHLRFDASICPQHPASAIRAVGFAEDPELGSIETPHGSVQFLQVAGLTLAEEEVMDRWHPRRFMYALQEWLPLLVTDLDRADLTADAGFTAAIDDGIRREGSWVSTVPAQKTLWRKGDDGTTLTIDAPSARRVGTLLPARLPYDRHLEVNPFDDGVRFLPGDEFAADAGRSGVLEVHLPEAAASELAALLRDPAVGTHQLAQAPGLEIVIVAK